MDTPPRPPSIRWPPPGLERLQGDLWRVAARGGLAGGLLVLPMLFVILREQRFSSLGPFADAWWVLLVLATVGLGFALDAVATASRILRRAARVMENGYDLRIVLCVAADIRRDTGFLLQGSRHFSMMEPRERDAVATLRVLTAGFYAAAGLWLPLVLGGGLLLAARGGLGRTELWALTLLPAAALYLCGAVFSAVEDSRVRRARSAWFEHPWAADLVDEEIAAWRSDLAALRGEEPAPALGARWTWLLRRVGVGVGFLGVLVAVPVLTLVPTSAVGPVLAAVALPRFTQIQRRAAVIEAFRSYRVTPDPSISPQEAGALLEELAYVGVAGPSGAGEKAPQRVFHNPWLPATEESNPVGVQPPLWSRTIFEEVARHPSPELVAFLRRIAAHPAQQDFGRLARAPAVDVAAGRWQEPLPADFTMASVPIPRLTGLREGSYARLASAALDLARKHPARAEEKVREVISVGFLLADGGPTLFDNLVGSVLVDDGATALEHLYRVTGRPAEADRIAELRGTAERAVRRMHRAAPAGLEGMLRYLPTVVTDTSAVPGLRWELFTLTTTLTPCINLDRMVFGPDERYRAFLESAHASLVRYPSEEGLFTLASAGYWGTVTQGNGSLVGRILAVSMRPGAGTCAEVMKRFDTLRKALR